MHDRQGDIIYVGKAKNLKKRVSSYFKGNLELLKTKKLVEKISTISTIITNSEVEALFLEDTLIKKHQPRYNIELKDNKRYPLVRIDFKKDYPRLEIVRIKIEQPGMVYFGPYSGSITRTVQLLNRLFPLVKCRNFKKEKGCLYKDMNKCVAPCLEDTPATKKAYKKTLKEVVVFLEGNGEKLINKWQKKMLVLSKEQKYEEAAYFRDQVEMLKRLIQPQVVVSQKGNFDLWVEQENQEFIIFYLFKIRQGRLSGDFHHKFTLDELVNKKEVFDRILLTYYQSNPDIPSKIYLPNESDSIKYWLKDVGIILVEENSLTNLARRNALLLISDEQNVILKRLQEIFDLPVIPNRIECYDISTTMGKDTVASRVVFVGGKPKKELYRHYIINTVQDKPDDFASMKEVLIRRLKESKGKDLFPDLIILDGGKGQLSVGMQALEQSKVDLPMISLAKREETIILSDFSEVKLPLDSMEMRLIINLRNEAHRFAVSFHRKRRKKRFIKSKLDDIKGIGDVTKVRLLKTFGSVDNIKKAGEQELEKVVSKKIAGLIRKNLS